MEKEIIGSRDEPGREELLQLRTGRLLQPKVFARVAATQNLKAASAQFVLDAKTLLQR